MSRKETLLFRRGLRGRSSQWLRWFYSKIFFHSLPKRGRKLERSRWCRWDIESKLKQALRWWIDVWDSAWDVKLISVPSIVCKPCKQTSRWLRESCLTSVALLWYAQKFMQILRHVFKTARCKACSDVTTARPAAANNDWLHLHCLRFAFFSFVAWNLIRWCDQ